MFVKIYITSLPGIEKVKPEDVVKEFTKKYVKFSVLDRTKLIYSSLGLVHLENVRCMFLIYYGYNLHDQNSSQGRENVLM